MRWESHPNTNKNQSISDGGLFTYYPANVSEMATSINKSARVFKHNPSKIDWSFEENKR